MNKEKVFPECCRGKDCPKFYSYDLSVDDMVYGCTKLGIAYNYGDDWLGVGKIINPPCPLKKEQP
jgi:hypothetical protein